MSALPIGLLWHDPWSANLGVAGLSQAHMRLVCEAGRRAGVEPEFRLVGWGEARERLEPPWRGAAWRVSGRALLGLDRGPARALRACRVVLDIGEGDSFSDLYGRKRLVYQLWSKALAASRGGVLVLAPQTLGPFAGPLARRAADAALRRARAVWVRDGLSLEYVRSRALGVPVAEATDVAFALPWEPVARPAGGPLRVGLNVSGLLWNAGARFGLRLDYRALMRAVAERLLASPGVEVVLVPHVVSPGQPAEDDAGAARALREQCPGARLAGPFVGPCQAKGYISGLDFFLGARMHACIAALSAGVPCVPLAYSRKFAGLFGSLGYPEVLDGLATDTREALERVMSAFERRAQLRAGLERLEALARQRLETYTDALTALLAEVARDGA